jgi:carbon-monoxide dehydrogenase large subunit
MSGKVEVLTGTTSQGQGHETTWAQIAADALGVDVDGVKVYHGDTGVMPMGIGSFGSRSLVVGGTAIHMAATRVLAKARSIAAHLLEAAEADVAFSGGQFAVSGAPDRTISFSEVALQAVTAHDLPSGMEPGLDEGAVFDPVDWSYPFGAHVAVVEVDTETGKVFILRYLTVDDCGNVVNPTIVEGQIHGGIAQGIGQALFEEVVYGAGGQLESGSFTTYLIPSAAELPNFDLYRTVTPSNTNPFGAKGVGEVGAVCAPPAVMNAIHDALAPFGIAEIDMPATPARVWRALVDALSSPKRGDAH